ncbi:hypothetical protein BJ973_007936 [Actinoplanes tereljensis]|uniref:Uncharacterized protein n=1 Tax=Paractinoplanes tereljensis TaxID=571912 RepID=A0A919TVX8_9ACTN|nr:hypothetical protein [Actinoplanes tereljensis]GIF24456.1 hypothetical protein Ate02nite_71860 [Actinoplanes tereljensis]
MADFDEFRIRDTRRFIENLEDTLAYTPAGQPVPGLDAIEGADASGTVYCLVRLDGRPARISITDGWWEAVGPEAIAGAVLQAYRFAQQKTVFARMVLRRHGRTHESPPNLEPEVPTGADDLDTMRRRIDQAGADIAAAMRLFEVVNDPSPRVVSGPRGIFTLTVRGTVIESAQVNVFGLRPEDATDLADDAREALLSVRPSYAHHPAEA